MNIELLNNYNMSNFQLNLIEKIFEKIELSNTNSILSLKKNMTMNSIITYEVAFENKILNDYNNNNFWFDVKQVDLKNIIILIKLPERFDVIYIPYRNII